MSCTTNNLKQPLSTLAEECPDISTYKSAPHTRGLGGNSWVGYILWFIIIAIIVWVILIATKPTWVQTYTPEGIPTGNIDQGKAITWSVVIALVIVIIIWIIRAATKKREVAYNF